MAAEIFTFAKQPWEDLSQDDTARNVKKAVPLDKPSQCPSAIYQMMEGCWEKQADERPMALALASLLASYDLAPHRGEYASTDVILGGAAAGHG